MQPFYKRFSVISGFAALLVLLVINSFVIRHQLARQVTDQAWVAHTQQVLLQLSETESLLDDAESGQRGYLYTGELRYLGPYDVAISQVDAHLRSLAELTADSTIQMANAGRLRLLAQQKLKELATTIALFDSGDPEGARKLVQSNSGFFTMAKTRALIGEMQQEEAALAAARTLAYRRSIGVTVACIYLASVLAGAGLVLLAYFILREMDLREKHAAQIKAREEWFRVTLTSIGDAVIATDQEGVVTFLNPVAERLTGISLAKAKGSSIDSVFPIFNEVTQQPAENPVRQVMQLGRIVGLANHTVLERADGSQIAIEDSAAPIHDDEGRLVGVVLVFRDATQERRSQEILRKTEKLAAAARMAASVAHEINNPLEAVGNLIYLAKNSPQLPPDVSQELTLAEQELARVSHIARQTLGFYREAKAPTTLDFPALVNSVLKLYSSRLGTRKVRVECDLKQSPPVHGWPGEMRQLISNLVSNAADAAGIEGTIRVIVSRVDTPAGQALQLMVTDNGPGIAPEHRQRIFEPFFTTKDVGTGLGLWVSKEIVERHGGTIQVDSRCGPESHGTTFFVLLPCADEGRSFVAKAV
ncbi:MAG TPA: CHASE3 domain-containing protein [Candidatus Binatia bacterium]|nr:CHASE3 domain-containing protein [Candidatus Binatia bacterium]